LKNVRGVSQTEHLSRITCDRRAAPRDERSRPARAPAADDAAPMIPFTGFRQPPFPIIPGGSP
jgi:hypothetical protein